MLPLAVTGIGIVSPLGVGREAWQRQLAVAHTESTFSTDSMLLSKDLARSCVAEVRDFDAKQYLGEKGLRNLDRLTKLLIVAAQLALEDAGIKRQGKYISLSPQQVGLCSSTAYGSLEAITELKLVAELEDPRYLNPARFPNTVINAAAGYVSIWEDLRAPNVTLVNGNCGALDAVLSCDTHLHNKRGDAFLIGGGEALSDALYIAFQMLGVLSDANQRFSPGDPQSEGMRLGEGAAYLCVERPEAARARGARMLGQVLGYGSAFEVPQSEAEIVHASERAVARAIEGALADAAVASHDIDLVCASTSGVPFLDAAELSAISSLFGDEVMVSAPKLLWGETLGASGAFAMAAALSWLNGVPQTAMLKPKTKSRLNKAVVTTVGYYGNVSAVVVQGAA